MDEFFSTKTKRKEWELLAAHMYRDPRSSLKRGMCGKLGAVQELVDGPSIKCVQALTSHPTSTIWNGTFTMTG
jgi:hypothetical protein